MKTLLASVLWLLASSHALAAPTGASILPLSVRGRDILTQNGAKFLYAATNLPGHQESMIPEGLQYQSAAEIAQWVADLGLNSVRLTYATQMVDEIRTTGDLTLEKAVIGGLGQVNGTKVLAQILARNKDWTRNTTRLQVFDAVANAFAKKNILVHLDNHISKAIWCCGGTDGNAWWGDTYFDADKWTQSWAWISAHAAKNWPTFASVGLRNELRQVTGSGKSEPYDWYTWYKYMTPAAAAVHKAAPNALIFFSGLNYDTTIQPLPLGQTLKGTAGTSSAGKTALFDPNTLGYKDKIVLEIHKYDFENTQDPCPTFEKKWYELGFQALNQSDPRTKYLFPVILSEWGFIQNGTYWKQTTYNKCLIEMVKKYKFGWMQWDMSGSYYVRTRNGASTQDDDEAWGLLNHTWNGLRSPVTIDNSLKPMIAALKG